MFLDKLVLYLKGTLLSLSCNFVVLRFNILFITYGDLGSLFSGLKNGALLAPLLEYGAPL